jgi:hypothetical protein
MNRPPIIGGVALARELRALLFDQAAIDEQGAGLNLVQAMVRLAEAIDRNTAELRRYNDRRDREDPQAGQ